MEPKTKFIRDLTRWECLYHDGVIRNQTYAPPPPPPPVSDLGNKKSKSLYEEGIEKKKKDMDRVINHAREKIKEAQALVRIPEVSPEEARDLAEKRCSTLFKDAQERVDRRDKILKSMLERETEQLEAYEQKVHRDAKLKSNPDVKSRFRQAAHEKKVWAQRAMMLRQEEFHLEGSSDQADPQWSMAVSAPVLTMVNYRVFHRSGCEQSVYDPHLLDGHIGILTKIRETCFALKNRAICDISYQKLLALKMRTGVPIVAQYHAFEEEKVLDPNGDIHATNFIDSIVQTAKQSQVNLMSSVKQVMDNIDQKMFALSQYEIVDAGPKTSEAVYRKAMVHYGVARPKLTAVKMIRDICRCSIIFQELGTLMATVDVIFKRFTCLDVRNSYRSSDNNLLGLMFVEIDVLIPGVTIAEGNTCVAEIRLEEYTFNRIRAMIDTESEEIGKTLANAYSSGGATPEAISYYAHWLLFDGRTSPRVSKGYKASHSKELPRSVCKMLKRHVSKNRARYLHIRELCTTPHQTCISESVDVKLLYILARFGKVIDFVLNKHGGELKYFWFFILRDVITPMRLDAATYITVQEWKKWCAAQEPELSYDEASILFDAATDYESHILVDSKGLTKNDIDDLVKTAKKICWQNVFLQPEDVKIN